MYAYVAAVRAVRGLPPVAETDPAAIAISRDPRAKRIAAAIKREVDRAPPLSADQIERLRGLLPYPRPAPDDSSTAA